MMIERSALYVPGDQPGKLAGARDRGADALIIDLEDAVAPDRKDVARQAAEAWLAQAPTGRARIWVRVNPGEPREAELRALAAAPALTGFCLAKAQDAAEIAGLDRLLTALGSEARLAPILESASAVLNAREIAAAPRVVRLQIGEADLRAELGIMPGPEESEMSWIRSWVVLASAAAGIGPPLAPVAADFRNADQFRASCLRLKRMGFRGRACIHPAQVALANEVFGPTAQEVAAARAVVAAFEAAGAGAFADQAGRMVDLPVARQARRVLDLDAYLASGGSPQAPA
ncbi:MAG TPA: aldolase/citrate lyase family protein [Streptosporangiaceae bacterium]|nr:aldolase/citrate lyase family protein [Streptosporangiaceae bacterium]